MIGFSNSDYINRKVEIGYWLLPEYQHKGIMTRCVRVVVNWAVNMLGIKRIAICCADGNNESNAIPKRLGFRFEGIQRCGELLSSGEYADINVYSFISVVMNLSGNKLYSEPVLAMVKSHRPRKYL